MTKKEFIERADYIVDVLGYDTSEGIEDMYQLFKLRLISEVETQVEARGACAPLQEK